MGEELKKGPGGQTIQKSKGHMMSEAAVGQLTEGFVTQCN